MLAPMLFLIACQMHERCERCVVVAATKAEALAMARAARPVAAQVASWRVIAQAEGDLLALPNRVARRSLAAMRPVYRSHRWPPPSPSGATSSATDPPRLSRKRSGSRAPWIGGRYLQRGDTQRPVCANFRAPNWAELNCNCDLIARHRAASWLAPIAIGRKVSTRLQSDAAMP